jgi:pilus assembly protein Flp/PilA
MILKRHRGTTITEYGLLLALLVVAVMGATSLLGNSLSNLNNSVSSQIVDATSGNGRTVANKNSKSASKSLLGVSHASLADFQEEIDMLSTTSAIDGSEVPYFQLPKTGSGGVNSTASEGDTAFTESYAQAIKVANQFLESAAKTDDESLKQWYLDTALQTVKLAKNQAAFEYNNTNNQELAAFAGATLSYQDAASSMKGWVSHLYGQQEALLSLQSRVSSSEFQIAKNLVYSVTDSTKEQYQLADSRIASQVMYDPLVSDIRKEAQKALIVSDSMALDSSALGSINMVNRADTQQ